MLKAYKFRIYPNNEQKVQIAKTFGCCRFVYNKTLAYRKEIYEKEKKSVSKTDCNNYCNRESKNRHKYLLQYHIWERYPNYLRKHFWKEHTFWTDGYFACSVGNVSEEMFRKYIENQG